MGARRLKMAAMKMTLRRPNQLFKGSLIQAALLSVSKVVLHMRRAYSQKRNADIGAGVDEPNQPAVPGTIDIGVNSRVAVVVGRGAAVRNAECNGETDICAVGSCLELAECAVFIQGRSIPSLVPTLDSGSD